MTTPLDHTDADLLTWAAQQTWSSFAQDVAAKGRRYGLTERQRAALEGMRAMPASTTPTAVKATGTAPSAAVPGFSTAIDMLGHIDASGNKWPKVFLSLKSDVTDDEEERRLKFYRYQNGDNMGSAGIRLDDVWLGNIDRSTGSWAPTLKAQRLDPETKAKVWAVLKLLRDDPRTLFARNGKLLGTCACCGRPLSNDESVQIGIGPECRAKLGGMF